MTAPIPLRACKGHDVVLGVAICVYYNSCLPAQEVLQMMAKALGARLTQLQLHRGNRSRQKFLVVEHLQPQEVGMHDCAQLLERVCRDGAVSTTASAGCPLVILYCTFAGV